MGGSAQTHDDKDIIVIFKSELYTFDDKKSKGTVVADK